MVHLSVMESWLNRPEAGLPALTAGNVGACPPTHCKCRKPAAPPVRPGTRAAPDPRSKCAAHRAGAGRSPPTARATAQSCSSRRRCPRGRRSAGFAPHARPAGSGASRRTGSTSPNWPAVPLALSAQYLGGRARPDVRAMGRQPARALGLVHAGRRHHPNLRPRARTSRARRRLRPAARTRASARAQTTSPGFLGAARRVSAHRAGARIPRGRGGRAPASRTCPPPARSRCSTVVYRMCRGFADCPGQPLAWRDAITSGWGTVGTHGQGIPARPQGQGQ